jgi:hypothetical protein
MAIPNGWRRKVAGRRWTPQGRRGRWKITRLSALWKTKASTMKTGEWITVENEESEYIKGKRQE